MVPIHVSSGVPEQAVGDEAVGVHAVDEWKGSLGVGLQPQLATQLCAPTGPALGEHSRAGETEAW